MGAHLSTGAKTPAQVEVSACDDPGEYVAIPDSRLMLSRTTGRAVQMTTVVVPTVFGVRGRTEDGDLWKWVGALAEAAKAGPLGADLAGITDIRVALPAKPMRMGGAMYVRDAPAYTLILHLDHGRLEPVPWTDAVTVVAGARMSALERALVAADALRSLRLVHGSMENDCLRWDRDEERIVISCPAHLAHTPVTQRPPLDLVFWADGLSLALAALGAEPAVDSLDAAARDDEEPRHAVAALVTAMLQHSRDDVRACAAQLFPATGVSTEVFTASSKAHAYDIVLIKLVVLAVFLVDDPGIDRAFFAITARGIYPNERRRVPQVREIVLRRWRAAAPRLLGVRAVAPADDVPTFGLR